jgi:hypothetical protein
MFGLSVSASLSKVRKHNMEGCIVSREEKQRHNLFYVHTYVKTH